MNSIVAAPEGISPANRTAAVRLIQILALGGLLLLLYAVILVDLVVEWWNDSAASHGLLVLPIAVWIGWRQRPVPAGGNEGDCRGLLLVASGCLLLLAGRLSSEFFLSRVSLLAVLAGVAWTFGGRRWLTAMAFPLILLASVIPLPVLVYNAIASPLQLFASNVATAVAQAAGVSVFRDGNIIHLANASLGVEEACSGLRSLTAMAVASLLLGYVEGVPVLWRSALLLFSIPLAIAINVLRVSGTAMIADYNVDYALGFYHSFSGWLVFVAGFAALWGGAKLIVRFSGAPR
jgi:exosortase